MNAKFGIVTMCAAAAMLMGTAGTALAGEGHRDHGRDQHSRSYDRGYRGHHEVRREEACRPKPPVCRPAPRCEDRRPVVVYRPRECETRHRSHGLVFVIGGLRIGR